MNILIYFVLPIAGSIFLIGSLFYGMRQLSEHCTMSRRKEGLLIAGYCAATLGGVLLGNTILNLAVLLALPVLARAMYGADRIRLFYYFTLVIAVYLTDALVSMGWQQLVGSGIVAMNSMELFYVSTIVVLRLMEFLVIRLFVLVIRRRQSEDFTIRQLVVSLILPGFSIINLLSFIVFMRIYMTEEMILLFLGNMLLLIAINIYFAVLVDTMSRNDRLEKELALSRQQAAMQMSYYQREEEKYEESRKLIHDIRNHVQVMEQLYQQEESPRGYLKEVHGMLNDLGQRYYTSNKLLNIILNDKAAQMRKYQIREDIRVGEVDLSFLQEMDVTTIFANIMDNAIASAAKSREPYIRMRVNQIHDMISISFENSCESEPVKRGRFYQSSKKGHQGIGMKNAAGAVERYHGDLQCEWREGVFYTKILLAAPVSVT